MKEKLFNLSNLTLFVALLISTVAAYYSIVGLTAIFAAAVIPIIIMGTILEVGKITTTVWLRKYWHRCGLILKTYLTIAVVILALLTSMGIFGFLSRAHIEQNVPTGDIAAKVSLLDEKIKTQKDNIEVSKTALTQLDNQINELLARGKTEQNAERVVQIRRQQAKERTQLQQDISKAQAEIAKLNEERAPIASQLRAVEAEVGPIKYIAALIYGDQLDTNLLEKAVRWVIIIIVLVFDPLAIALVLAANNSKIWDKEDKEKEITEQAVVEPKVEPIVEEPIVEEPNVEPIEKPLAETHPYLFKTGLNRPAGFETVGPQVYVPTKEQEIVIDSISEPEKDNVIEVKAEDLSQVDEKQLQLNGVTKLRPYTVMDNDYVVYDGKHMAINALKELKPDLFIEANNQINNFGNKFPRYAGKNEMFIRTDLMPTKVFKFDGKDWIESDKVKSALQEGYIKFLITKIDCGEYDINVLSEDEKTLIKEYLNKT